MFIKTPTYLLYILKNFLTERAQMVRIRESISDFLPVLSGVPQGCVISPLFFNVYINDMLSLSLESSLKLFADDSKLFNYSENCSLIQNDLNTINEWCVANSMSINIDKTVFIRLGKSNCACEYSINNKPIANVDSVKDLGIIADRKLLLKDHSSKVLKNQTISNLMPCVFSNSANRTLNILFSKHLSYR
jgi:ribonucleases P/MRP protein subunit RPP40